jgi:hypothetical protein
MQCQCCPFQRWVKKTLAKKFITNPTHVDFLNLAFFIQGFETSTGSRNKGIKLQDHHLAKSFPLPSNRNL